MFKIDCKHFKKKLVYCIKNDFAFFLIPYINASVVLNLALELANAWARKTQSDKNNFAIFNGFDETTWLPSNTSKLPKSPVGDVSKSAVARSYIADFPGNFLYRPCRRARERSGMWTMYILWWWWCNHSTINSVTNFNNFLFLMRHVSFNSLLTELCLYI